MSLHPRIERLRYRLRYYWRKACHFAGFCPKCGGLVNYARGGRAICPGCGK